MRNLTDTYKSNPLEIELQERNLVNCPVCNIHVNSVFLRMESPKCERGHSVGKWVHCMNESEKHVYLSLDMIKCPFCGNPDQGTVGEGLKVRCLFINSSGIPCNSRPFVWIKEGPPCFMNHVGKMELEGLVNS